MNDAQIKKKLIQITPAPVKRLIKHLPQKAGMFIVGGAVRDALLRRTTKDIDIVVCHTGITTLQNTLKKMGSVELVGRAFGVFKWVPRGWKDEAIDVALPRKDHAFGTGGYKHVKAQSNPKLPIEKDLMRRDFTVNALAYDIKARKLIDAVGGLNDLASRQLRTVGEAHKRFQEDYSRMLRGLRFATQLGFMFEAKTAKTMRLMMDNLENQTGKNEWIVPRETIAQELIKMFIADPVRAFDLCMMQRVFEVLIPEILSLRGCPQPSQYHAEGDVLQHTRLALEKIQDAYYAKKFKDKPSALLLFAVLLHDVGKPLTITYPEADSKDRIRYNGHDAVGADVALHIAHRLHLSVFSRDDNRRHVNADDLAWLVRHHLVGFRNDIMRMKPSTIEKYYFHDYRPSKELLRLQCLDTIATVGKNKKIDDSGYKAIYRTVTRLEKTRKKSGVKTFLTGHEVMEIKNVKPGPQVGEHLRALRDAQLKGKVRNKQGAVKFIKSL